MAYVDSDKELERLRERFMGDTSILPANRKAVEKHLSFMQAKGSNPRTLIKHLYCIKTFFAALDRKVDVNKATRDDLEKAVGRIEGGKLGSETKRDVRSVIKAFYKHLQGEDLYYPRHVAWIKTSNRRGKRMLPEDILSEADVEKMLRAAKNQRDRTIIALLFDSGIRMGELMNLKVKDVDMELELAHITVNGKTGMRRIPLMFSVPYVAQYLNENKNKKPSDPLWHDIGSWRNLNKVPDYGAIRKRLQEIGKDAGLHKRIYPHLFRHSRATFYANRLTEQQLKAFFGWTGDSKMASTYVHLSGRDLDNSILKAYGMKGAEEASAPTLTVKECPRCKLPNQLDSTYCARCGLALDIQTLIKTSEYEKRVKKVAVKSAKEGDAVDRLAEALLKRARKKEKKD